MSKVLNRIFALSLISALVLSTTACGKEEGPKGPTLEEVQSQLILTQNELNSVKNELQGTKEVLATYNPSLAGVDLSSIAVLPTGQRAYTSINDRIRLSSDLTMNPSVTLPNTTKIMLGGNISYIPSNNWTFELSNNSLLLQHKNGMLVRLKVYQYIGSATPYDVSDSVIRPYLKNLCVTETGVKKLFINNSVVGSMVYNTMLVKDYKDSDVLEQYIEEPVVETTVAVEETEAVNSELETGIDTNESIAETVESVPMAGFGVSENSATTVESTELTESIDSTESVSDSIEESVSESGAVSLSDIVSESVSSDNQIEIVEEKELDYTIDSYNYNVGVVFSGEYALTIEVFYKNDENASIQQELFNSSLSSITIDSQKLLSE